MDTEAASLRGEQAGDEGPAAAGTQDSASSSFQACLELLKGPTDEKRLVGLLLAVKAMQRMRTSDSTVDAAQEESIRAVSAAVGDKFIDRLLLPVSQGVNQAVVTADEEERETQCMLVGAAMAVLTVFCRVPDLATQDAMLDRLPALTKVIGVGGVRALITGVPPTEAAGRVQDEALVQDALDCTLQLASYGRPTSAALLESGALMAAAKVLARESLLTHKLLAVRLVAALAAGPGVDRQLIFDESSSVLPAVIRGSAALLGDSRLLDRQAVPNGKPQPVALESDVDAATLQLEALHALLLLLPLPEGSEAAEQLQQEGAADRDEPRWAGSARHGLNWILRSRTGGAQRLAALQLAAAMVELRGPGWILEPAGSDSAPDGFLQVLTETLYVEQSLLLHDALHPHRLTTFHPPTPQSVARLQEELDGCNLDEEDVTIEGVPKATAPSGMPQDKDVTIEEVPKATGSQQEAGSTEQEGVVADPQEPGSVDWPSSEPPRPKKIGEAELERAGASEKKILEQQAGAPNTQKAGERANQFLPACYRLMEAVVEVLCQQEGEGEGEGDVGESRSVRNEVAERVMKTLGSIVDDVLQFMEASAETPGATQDPVVLGAIRVLGAYYAQAPEAAGKLVQELLPFMMKVESPSALQLSGPHFLVPMLLMCTTQVQPTEAQLDWRRFLLQHHTDVLAPVVTYTSHLARKAAHLTASTSASTGTTGTTGSTGSAGSTGSFGNGKRSFDAFRSAAVSVGATNERDAGLRVAPPPLEVLSLESRLWDACEVLLAVIDKGASSDSPQHLDGRVQDAGREFDLGPVTQVMLPLVWELGSWVEARLSGLSADCAAAEVVTRLCRAQVEPGVWVSAAAVAAVVLQAVVRSRLLRGGESEGGRGSEGERGSAAAGAFGALVFGNVPEAAVGSACWLIAGGVLGGAAALCYVADSEQGKSVSEEELSWSEQLLEGQLEQWDRTAGAATSILEGCPAFVSMCSSHVSCLKSLLQRGQVLDVDLVNLQLLVGTLTAICGQ